MYRFLLLPFIILCAYTTNGQASTKQPPLKRWEASVNSGLFLDLFYANIVFGGDDSKPPSYSTIPGRRVQPGIMNRLEIKYLLNTKSALSLNYSHANWRDIIGDNLDPLEVWTGYRLNKRRMQFTLNYYRIFKSGKRGLWSIGSGFQVQIEKISFPYYRTEDPSDPFLITDIGARPASAYFEDWAVPLTVAHHWRINQNLMLGIMFHSAYTIGTGVDGAALMGSIAIPFGNDVRPKVK
jgi:hypothetical protein